MHQLAQSARLLVSDLASTLVFLMVLLVTKDLILAAALGIGLGTVQIGWLLFKRKPIDIMQWLSIGLVLVSGVATLLTSDARFIMAKPSIVYCIVGAYMLRPGWLNRYLPPIAIATVPDLAYAFGYVWAGLMFGSAALNLAVGLNTDAITWASVMSIWGIASKIALFGIQYVTMKTIGMRRGRAAAGLT